MGTAVLFPHDCLPISKSRHSRDLLDAFTGSPIGCKSTLHFFDSPLVYSSQARHSFIPYHGVGPLYLDQASNEFTPYGSNPSQRPVEQRQFKFNRLPEQSGASSSTISAPNAPGFAILGHPKGKAAPKELIADFLNKSGTNRNTSKVSESRMGNGAKSAQTVLLDRRKKNGSNGKKGSVDSETVSTKLSIMAELAITEVPKGDRCQFPNAKLGVVKGRRSCDNRYDVVMTDKGLNQGSALDASAEHNTLRTMKGAENSSFKVTNGNQPSRAYALGDGLMRLRRASTDPQIVEHLGHYRSQRLDVPSSHTKSCHGFTRSTSMSLPERWAGPAYFSSPAPSSLPLPKFSLLGHKTPSLNVPPLLGEQRKSKMTMPVELGSRSAATDLEVELDVAFATKSLRRMLKLDLS